MYLQRCYPLATFIGTVSGGTNGNVTNVTLPGGILASFTGLGKTKKKNKRLIFKSKKKTKIRLYSRNWRTTSTKGNQTISHYWTNNWRIEDEEGWNTCWRGPILGWQIKSTITTKVSLLVINCDTQSFRIQIINKWMNRTSLDNCPQKKDKFN